MWERAKSMGRHGPGEEGASIVEFAVLAPLLFLLILGLLEMGWALAQNNDVRHGAREGARFAAVDGGSVSDIRDRVCSAMGGLDVGMSQVLVEVTDGGALEGDIATIRVQADITSLTGFPGVSIFLPPNFDSEVDFRLEDDLSNWSAPTTVQLTC